MRWGLTADLRAQVGIELAPLILDKVTGKPKRDPSTGYMMNHSLSTTDVTQLATSKGYIAYCIDRRLTCITLSNYPCIQAPALARCGEQAAVLGATHRLKHKYMYVSININHLTAGQVAEKTNIGQLGRKMDDQQQRQHFESWESYWGR